MNSTHSKIDLSPLLATWRALVDADEHEAAIALAEQCAGVSDDSRWFVALGIACARRGLTARAVLAFSEACRRDGTAPAVHTHLADAQIDACDYEAAALSLQRACALDPEAEDPAGKRARLLIAKTRKQLASVT